MTRVSRICFIILASCEEMRRMDPFVIRSGISSHTATRGARRSTVHGLAAHVVEPILGAA